MFAVVQTGSKQYRVKEGDTIKVEKLDSEAGKTLKLDTVLMVGDADTVKIGTPMVEGALVEAEVMTQTRGKKVNIIKFNRRKHHMKRQGHRQNLTVLKIKKITH